jgi:hypothetical protein
VNSGNVLFLFMMLKIKCGRRIARMGEVSNEHILVPKSKVKMKIWRRRHRFDDIIKEYLKEIRCEIVN